MNQLVEAPTRPKHKVLFILVGCFVAAAIVAAFLLGKASDGRGARAVSATARQSSSLPVSVTSHVPFGATAIRPNTWVQWDSAQSASSSVFAVSGLVIRPSSQKTQDGIMPLLRITAPSGAEITLQGAVNSGAQSADLHFGVGRFDPDTAVPQVVMTSFTGGAHCCLEITLADFVAGEWKKAKVYDLDGDDIAFPSDINADGYLDFSIEDDRFNYAFASHAGSWTPPLILNILDGRVVDVSKRPAFRQVFISDMTKAENACTTGEVSEGGQTSRIEANGACAAYVADAARLGQVNAAWATMLAHYDHTNGDGGDGKSGFLPTKCFAPLVNYVCPPGKEHIFATFPESLRWFLGDTGYLPPIAIAPN